jgi:hypothetical protein
MALAAAARAEERFSNILNFVEEVCDTVAEKITTLADRVALGDAEPKLVAATAELLQREATKVTFAYFQKAVSEASAYTERDFLRIHQIALSVDTIRSHFPALESTASAALAAATEAENRTALRLREVVELAKERFAGVQRQASEVTESVMTCSDSSCIPSPTRGGEMVI